LDLVPIEAMMLVEARVFRGDDGVLKIGRDLTQRNKFVAFAIGRAVDPGLQVTLGLHCCGRRVDPRGGQKKEHGEQPERRQTDEKPPNKRSKNVLPKQGPGVRVGPSGHLSESYKLRAESHWGETQIAPPSLSEHRACTVDAVDRRQTSCLKARFMKPS
jgi:hypothetical protein